MVGSRHITVFYSTFCRQLNVLLAPLLSLEALDMLFPPETGKCAVQLFVCFVRFVLVCLVCLFCLSVLVH